MKMRQYESGKRFCDGVVELGGTGRAGARVGFAGGASDA